MAVSFTDHIKILRRQHLGAPRKLTGFPLQGMPGIDGPQYQCRQRRPLHWKPKWGRESSERWQDKTLKYLWIYTTSNPDRPDNVRKRKNKAYRYTYSVINAFQVKAIRKRVMKLIWNIIIAPTVTYGLKTCVLTKVNKQSLWRMKK